jgi:hypothetical protein
MIQIRSSIQKKTKIEKIRLKYRLSSYSWSDIAFNNRNKVINSLINDQICEEISEIESGNYIVFQFEWMKFENYFRSDSYDFNRNKNLLLQRERM